jgi:hypothetical protein
MLSTATDLVPGKLVVDPFVGYALRGTFQRPIQDNVISTAIPVIA